MKRKFLMVLLAVLCAVCLAAAFSACASCDGETPAADEQPDGVTSDGDTDDDTNDNTNDDTNTDGNKATDGTGTTDTDGETEQAHTYTAPIRENEVAATCTEGGGYDSVIYCATCGEQLYREHITTPASGHTLVRVEEKPATCGESGWAAYEYCTVCDYSTYSPTAALEHNYEGKVTAEPTYDTAGIRTYTCINCGDSYTEVIAVLGHAHEYESTVTREATCDQAGVMTYTCKLCGDSYDEKINPAGHTPAAAVTENETAATCTENGGYDSVYYCSVCGKELDRQTTVIPYIGHSWNDGRVTTAPTCTEDGVKTFTCYTCGAIETQKIAATNHTLIHVEAQTATCSQAGWAAYEYCIFCNYTTLIEIPATAHIARKHGFYVENGRLYIDGSTEAASQGELISLGGSIFDNTEVDCQTSSYGYISCEVCGGSFMVAVTGAHSAKSHSLAVDSDGYLYIDGSSSIATQFEFTAIGGVMLSMAGCNKTGNGYIICDVCDSELIVNILNGHTASAAIIENEVAATCTQDGYYDSVVYCSECGEQISRETITIESSGHTYGDGYAIYESGHCKICTVCGEETETESHEIVGGVCAVCGYTEKTAESELEFTLSDDGLYYIVSGIGAAEGGEITIPDAYSGLPVTEVGASAFLECTTITSVVIADSVVTIGADAFYGCSALVSVTLGSGVTTISGGAFYGCGALVSITIPASVTTIGKNAFRECSSLKTVIFEGGGQWYRTHTNGATSGGTATNMTDSSTAAKHLTTTYPSYFWYRG